MAQPIATSPCYRIVRRVSSPDAAPITNEAYGFNASTYDYVRLKITPDPADTPTVEVQVWSSLAGQFISAEPPSTATGPGAGVPFVMTFTAMGDVLAAKVTNITGEIIVEAAGHRSGQPG